mmetsp:Transcript_29024/g.72379  ORF Transcript_29024/g.72379 Transcript_29024/m.72379 type:complete len:93 (-) Transcript_29024:9-287(-)
MRGCVRLSSVPSAAGARMGPSAEDGEGNAKGEGGERTAVCRPLVGWAGRRLVSFCAVEISPFAVLSSQMRRHLLAHFTPASRLRHVEEARNK